MAEAQDPQGPGLRKEARGLVAGTSWLDGAEALVLHGALGILLALMLLLVVKAAMHGLRLRRACTTVLDVGLVGLAVALVAVRRCRVLKVTMQGACSQARC